MSKFRGILALDIDGTVTTKKDVLPEKTLQFINQLIENEVVISFITGRTFSFARPLFTPLVGPYFLAPQNGSALFQMPQTQLIVESCLTKQEVLQIQALCQTKQIGLLIETGYQRGDICYYNIHDFHPKWHNYLNFRAYISQGQWKKLEDLNQLPEDRFACIKFFSDQPDPFIKQAYPYLNCVTITDPFCPGGYLTLITQELASKGCIVSKLKELYPGRSVIAAGDDLNDLSMLAQADVKIVMQTAPKQMWQQADILAKPAAEEGIIEAIKKAIL
jgi:hydroxymethylpyrimidine pyrophosphatase-like HAD family hydrolase